MSVFKRQQQSQLQDIPTIQLQDHIRMELILTDKVTNQRIDDLYREIGQRFEDAEKRTELARMGMEKRLEGMNEFRDQLREQAGKFITQERLDAMIASYQPTMEANRERVNILEKANANMQGRMWAVGVAFTIISTIISIGVHFIK